MKKIAFVGTSSVGKSTMLNAFKQQYAGDPTVVCLEEAARQFFIDNPIPIEKRYTAEVQQRIFDSAKNQEIIAENLHPTLLFCDRSVIDATMFMMVGGFEDLAQKLIKENWDRIQSYHKIYLLDPSDMSNQIDEQRLEDDQARQILHTTFLNFFKDYSVDYQLLSGTIDERTAKVQRQL